MTARTADIARDNPKTSALVTSQPSPVRHGFGITSEIGTENGCAPAIFVLFCVGLATLALSCGECQLRREGAISRQLLALAVTEC